MILLYAISTSRETAFLKEVRNQDKIQIQAVK